MDLLESVISKIEAKTITIDDINALIAEAVPASTVDRVRRRTRRTPTASHIDNRSGHQHLNLPKFQARVAPKRKPVGNTQMRHRGKAAHKRSARTQKRQYAEALQFLKKHIGKPIAECQTALAGLSDKLAMRRLLVGLLNTDNLNKEWLRGIYESL